MVEPVTHISQAVIPYASPAEDNLPKPSPTGAECHPQESDMFLPDPEFATTSHVSSLAQYKAMHELSVDNPAAFWRQEAVRLGITNLPEDKDFVSWNFDCRKGDIFVKWIPGAKANLCYSCLDLNILRGLGDKVAFHWEGNNPRDTRSITYKEMHKEVCKFANVLKRHGVCKGDSVGIYLPMVLELPIAMLGCARIGAIHTVVFAGFSAGSLKDRILDSKCKVVVTADGAYRGAKYIPLKTICDEAILLSSQEGHKVTSSIVLPHLTSLCSWEGPKDAEERLCHYQEEDIAWYPGRDYWWDQEMETVEEDCPPAWMDSEDTLFLLYTSGSTGKPKGIAHATGGYMLHVSHSLRHVFDCHPEDIYWCTADIGWITGHTCTAYGPLLNGLSAVLFEGIPKHPHPGRIWEIVDKHKVTQFFTAPTAIRMLMKSGDAVVQRYSRKSLKVLGTAGEPINPEAWLWYHSVVGEGRCPIVDTYWQTETGAPMLTPLPGAVPTKPGSACTPYFGVVPAILDEEGREIPGPGEGYLAFKQPWPGMMKTIFNNKERFENTYFKTFPGYYTTGDGARSDEDDYIWVTGRIDDMLNVSGHLLSTAEVESCLAAYPGVAEAAAVSKKHPIKGESLYCFVTTKDGVDFSEELVTALKAKVRRTIGAFATPEHIQNAPALPKTRSGKIMRRVLRKIVDGEEDLGDLSTLADPAVIEFLLANLVT